MKLKLSHSEFIQLLTMYINIVLPYRVDTPTNKLLYALMIQVYEKLYKMAIKPRKSYLIHLSIAEAIAFWFFWQQHEFEDSKSFEANLIRITNNSIHQKMKL